MKQFIVLLSTKFVGNHTVIIKAKNIEDAKSKARKLENQYNSIISVKQV